MTSNNPRTVSLSIGQSLTKPCSAIWEPPMPCRCACGNRGRRPDNKRLASRSPELSPATMAIVVSADDATSRRCDEFAHQTDMHCRFGCVFFLLQQRLLGLFQRQAGAVNR